MKDFGRVQSTVKPEPLIVDDFSVWVHTDIEPISITVGEDEFNGFEYNMVQYDKDEYIQQMAEKIENFEGIDADSAEFIQGLKEGLNLV